MNQNSLPDNSSVEPMSSQERASFEQQIAQLKEENARLREANTTDELTRMHNRRYVNEHEFVASLKKREGGEQRREVLPTASILFFDIDHFKDINDTYGHAFGDHVLRAIGNLLSSHFRDMDITARWGGEEFIAILPGADRAQAAERAEQLRMIIENTIKDMCLSDPQYKNNPTYVELEAITVSIGVADSTEAKDFDNMQDKADQALYWAKEGGRNKVMVYSEILAREHVSKDKVRGTGDLVGQPVFGKIKTDIEK